MQGCVVNATEIDDLFTLDGEGGPVPLVFDKYYGGYAADETIRFLVRRLL